MYNSKLAKYYDALYSSKDYTFEASLIKKFCKNKSKLIDVGCGTLSHSILLKDDFNEICGIDISSEMIEIARQKILKKNIKNINAFNIKIDEINSKSYDCGISMFNVINHIIKLDELISFFKNFSRILNTGGVLIFDSWNEAAAISDPPIKNIKTSSYHNLKIISSSNPQNLLLDSLVNIEYSHSIYKNELKIDDFSLNLKHRLWPKFIVEDILCNLNFEPIKIFSTTSNVMREPTVNDYKITYVFKKC